MAWVIDALTTHHAKTGWINGLKPGVSWQVLALNNLLRVLLSVILSPTNNFSSVKKIKFVTYNPKEMTN